MPTPKPKIQGPRDPRDTTSVNSVDRLPELPISSRFPAPGLRLLLALRISEPELAKSTAARGLHESILDCDANGLAINHSISFAARLRCLFQNADDFPPVSQDASMQGQSSSPIQQRLILSTVFVPFLAVDALEKGSSHCPRTPSQFPSASPAAQSSKESETY